jgi:hypothetical protein
MFSGGETIAVEVGTSAAIVSPPFAFMTGLDRRVFDCIRADVDSVVFAEPIADP